MGRLESHPERLATPGSEFCVVARDGGMKRKQRVLKLCDRASKDLGLLRSSSLSEGGQHRDAVKARRQGSAGV